MCVGVCVFYLERRAAAFGEKRLKRDVCGAGEFPRSSSSDVAFSVCVLQKCLGEIVFGDAVDGVGLW